MRQTDKDRGDKNRKKMRGIEREGEGEGERERERERERENGSHNNMTEKTKASRTDIIRQTEKDEDKEYDRQDLRD